ncbi:MAG: hypothetical protein WC789_09240 [Lentisphaeria bacterium]
MRYLIALNALALVLASMSMAAEQIDLKPAAGPKPTKAERIEKLKQDIFKAERIVETVTEARIARREKENPKFAEQDRRARANAIAKLPPLRTELAWLEGRLTLAAAESAAKAREADLARAKPDDPGRASIEAALAEARREMDLVKRLEAEKDF